MGTDETQGSTVAEIVTPPEAPTIARWLTEEEVNGLGPEGFAPSEAQKRYLAFYLAADFGAKMSEIAKAAGIPYRTAYEWHDKHLEFKTWLEECLLHCLRGELPGMWRAVLKRACEGSDRAAHMVALRYDSPYREAVQKDIKSGPKAMSEKSNLGGVLAELEARKGGGNERQGGQGTGGKGSDTGTVEAMTGLERRRVVTGAAQGKGREGGTGGA